jgi:hypothetical protein
MDYKVIYSPNAISDLAEVVGFVAQDDPQAALESRDPPTRRHRARELLEEVTYTTRPTPQKINKVRSHQSPAKRFLAKALGGASIRHRG